MNMNKKVEINLDIRSKFSVIYIVGVVIWYIFAIIMFKNSLVTSEAYISKYSTNNKPPTKSAWGIEYCEIVKYERRGAEIRWELIEKYNWYDESTPIEFEYNNNNIFKIVVITVLVFVVPILLILLKFVLIKQHKVVLTEYEIHLLKRRLFITKNIHIPIDKIDSIYILNSVADIFRGGETIIIFSNRIKIQICCVYNAEEFTELVMKRCKEMTDDDR